MEFNAREQWFNLPVPYRSNQVSAILPIFLRKHRISNIGGIGLTFFNDETGIVGLQTTGLTLSLAYNLRLSKDDLHHLDFGLQGGFFQRRLSLNNNVQTGNQYSTGVGFDGTLNSGLPIISQSASGNELAAGLMYYFNPDKDFSKSDISADLGLGVYHLLPVNLSLTSETHELPMLINIYGSLSWHTSKRFYIQPHVLSSLQDGNVFLNTGMLVHYIFLDKHTVLIPHKLRIGFYYRHQDAIAPLIGFGNEFYNIGFSYDVSTSLGGQIPGTGSIELSMQISLYTPRNDGSLYLQPRYQLDK